jgi:hypothetical protein
LNSKEPAVKLEELLKTIEESDASDWTVFDRPTFAQDIQQVSGGLHQVPWVEVHEHHSLLSYRSDLRISIALGLTHRADFVEDWAQSFSDKHASSSWVDFRYNGVPVYRGLRVLVDGGRAGLPCPAQGSKDIPKRQYYIWRLIDELIGSEQMDDYFRRAKLNIVDVYWPGPKN